MASKTIEPGEQAKPRASAGQFEPRFHRASIRLRGRSVLRGTARALPWMQAAWIVVFLAGRIGIPAFPPTWTLAALAAILALTVFRHVWGSPTGPEAALIMDRQLGTRELVTSARELGAESSHPFARLARQRAAEALADDAVARALPWTHWRPWRPALLGLCAAILAGLIPPLNLMPPTSAGLAEPDPVVQATAETLAEELETLREEMTEQGRPESRDALEQLQKMVDAMRGGGLPTQEDALVALNKTRQTLAALSEETSDELGQLVSDLAADPLSSDLARAMSDQDRHALGESLRQMAEALSPEEAQGAAAQRQLQRLAKNFAGIADFLQKMGGQDLARAVRELARALEAGDLKRAQELLESAQMQMALELAAQLGKKDGIGKEMAELLQYARYQLSKQSTPECLAGGECKPAKLGGKGSKGGPGPGKQSTNKQTKGYRAGLPILRDRQSAKTSSWSGDFEALYDSQVDRDRRLTDLQVTGQVGAGGEMLSEIGRAEGVRGKTSLPLRGVAGTPAAAPERAVDLESVPLGYRDLVRNYFTRDSIEPKNIPKGDSP